MRALAQLAILAMTLTGCTVAIEGSPAPALTGPELPSRPQELRLDSLEPCSLLTRQQIDLLGVSDGSPDVSGTGSDRELCQWDRFPAEPQDFYMASLDLAQGAEYAFGSVTGYRLVDVAGFGAVESQRPDAPPDSHCLLALDVADGQNVLLVYSYEGSTVPMTRELACEKAAVAAEMVIRTLDELVGMT